MDGLFLAFSLYFSHIGGKNYSYMYGSLTAIVLLLLWLYFACASCSSGRKSIISGRNCFPGKPRSDRSMPVSLDKGRLFLSFW
ncbi:MAG: hypothetical protein ACLR0U_18020 [Enterocloster clostridioformis]